MTQLVVFWGVSRQPSAARTEPVEVSAVSLRAASDRVIGEFWREFNA